MLYAKLATFIITVPVLIFLVKTLVTNGYWWIAVTLPLLAYIACRIIGCDKPTRPEWSEPSRQ